MGKNQLRCGRGAIDGLSVYIHPVTKLIQPFLDQGRNGSVRAGTHIETQVATPAHRINQKRNQLAFTQIILHVLVPVVSKACADATGLLPLTPGEILKRLLLLKSSTVHLPVLTGQISSMEASGIAAPPIVNHNFILNRGLIIQPGDKVQTVPLPTGIGPLPVCIENAGTVSFHQLLHLGNHFFHCIFWYICLGHIRHAHHRVKPFKEAVIQTPAQAVSLCCIQKLSHNVPVGTNVYTVPVPAVVAWPQTEAVMMLGGQHDVFCSGPPKQLRPFVRVKHLRLPLAGKVLITKSLPVHFFMKFIIWGEFFRHLPSVPLGIGQSGGIHILSLRGIGGDGIQPPVHKYA